jgi:hypothetical protein
MVSLLPTMFHEILLSNFRGVALTNCVTDRRTGQKQYVSKVGIDINRSWHWGPFGPKCHELFVILCTIDLNYLKYKPRNQCRSIFGFYVILDRGLVQYTIYWTSFLTKTNSVNKNIKYNIVKYLTCGLQIFISVYIFYQRQYIVIYNLKLNK